MLIIDADTLFAIRYAAFASLILLLLAAFAFAMPLCVLRCYATV